MRKLSAAWREPSLLVIERGLSFWAEGIRRKYYHVIQGLHKVIEILLSMRSTLE